MQATAIAEDVAEVVARFADPTLGLLASEDELRAWVAEGAALDPPLSPEASIRRMVPVKHGGLVTNVALKHQGRGLDLDDLISEGTLGLIWSARKYELHTMYGSPPRPVKFGTYATWAIRQKIYRAVLDRGSQIRLPENLRKWLNNPEELTPAQKEDDRYKAAVSALSRRFVSGSSPGPLGEDGEWFDRMPGGRRRASRGADECHVLLADLGERERGVVADRYGIGGDPKTLREIAAERGCTYQRIQQVEKDAMRRLVVAARRHRITYEQVFGETA